MGRLAPQRVDAHAERVNGLRELGHVLAHILVAHSPLVEAVEIGVERYEHLLVEESLAAERHVAVGRALLAQVLELLAVPEMQIEITHVGRERQARRVGHEYRGVVAAVRDVIDHHAPQQARLLVFRLDIEVPARNLVVERPLRDLELGRLLPGREEQRPHLDLGAGQHVVLEEERPDRHQRDEDDQRAHGLHQRDAGGLNGRQLRLLPEIAESHQTRQQDGEGQRHRHHADGGVEEKFGQKPHRQPFAHQVVDVSPQELHQHDEEHDEKCHREKWQKTF